MAIKWIHGDFATGAINENNELPVAGNNDKSTVDVNAGDNSTISMSKRDLGSNWKDIVSEGVTLVAEVDTDAAWDSPNAVRTGGWVNKIDGRINDLITAQIVGYREYLAARICTPFFTGGTTKPKDGVKFEAGTWQGLMALIAIDSFKPIPGSPSQPPTNLGTVFADTSGTGVQRATRLADAENYAAILDDIRDNLSPNGNEYRFVLRWADASKTSMVWDVYVGNDTDGKINWAGTNTNIVLDAEDFAHLDFKLSLSSESIANRVIAQSKAGDDSTNTGADYTVVTESNGLPLFDTFWNPGQELEQPKLLEGAVARVQDLKTPKGTASYEVKGEVSYWKAKLGSKLTFSGGTDIDTSGYNITVRCTGVNWSASNKKLTIDIMLPQARYPRLPSSKSKTDNPMFGGDWGAGGGGNTPVGGGYQGGNDTGIGNNFKFDELSPPFVPPVPDTNPDRRIACGSDHVLAIAADGSLYAWGENSYVELGYDTTPDYSSSVPKQVGTDKDWVAVYASGYTSYAKKKNGTLWGWGQNNVGQLGLGNQTDAHEPTLITDKVKNVWIKTNLTLHIQKDDGTLWTCGYNQNNILGILSDTDFVTSLTKVTDKTDWVTIETAASSGNYLLALDSAGDIWECGFQIGALKQVFTPVKFTDIYVSYAAGEAGNKQYYAAGRSTDGKLYTWGVGYHDESGIVSTRTLPDLYGSATLTSINKFLYCGTCESRPRNLIMVITNEGKLFVFGKGNSASIVSNAATPFEYGANTNFDWRKPYFVRTSERDWLAILNGALWIGGFNYYGELGRGDNISTAPLIYQIGTETNWIRVNTTQGGGSGYFSLATLGDSMYATGYNGSGQLGLGTASTPNKVNKTSWTVQPTSNGTI